MEANLIPLIIINFKVVNTFHYTYIIVYIVYQSVWMQLLNVYLPNIHGQCLCYVYT